MKKYLFFLLLTVVANAQSSSAGPYSLTASQCSPPIATDGRATVAFQVLGSWTGTIQPKLIVDGQAPVNAQVKPANSSTAQSTVTANGAYIAAVSGYNSFQVCGATITNTAKIYLNTSQFAH